jgi:hypothetical protein
MYVLTAVLEVYRSRTEFCTYLISVYSAVHDNLSVMQREREAVLPVPVCCYTTPTKAPGRNRREGIKGRVSGSQVTHHFSHTAWKGFWAP